MSRCSEAGGGGGNSSSRVLLGDVDSVVCSGCMQLLPTLAPCFSHHSMRALIDYIFKIDAMLELLLFLFIYLLFNKKVWYF